MATSPTRGEVKEPGLIHLPPCGGGRRIAQAMRRVGGVSFLKRTLRHQRSNERSSVFLVASAARHLRRLDQSARNLLAIRVEIQPPARSKTFGIVVHVHVKNVPRSRNGLEPVDVVLVVRDGAQFAGAEVAIDGRLDEEMILVALELVVVAAA